MRFLAIAMVVAHHVASSYLPATHRLGTQQLPHDWHMIGLRSPLVAWIIHLSFGVQVFFVISGFVLGLPFVKGTPSIKAYLARRVVRLEPPYAIHLLIFYVLLVFIWPRPETHDYMPNLVASLVYLHGPIFGEPSRINGVAWTLEIEVQFYLLMPLIAQIFRLRNLMWRRVLMVCVIAVCGLLAQEVIRSGNQRLMLSLAGYLQYFLAGLLLADVYSEPPSFLPTDSFYCDLGALVSGGMVALILHGTQSYLWVTPFLISLFALFVLRGRWTSQFFSIPLLTVVGGMCYTMYLYHTLFIGLLLPYSTRMFPETQSLLFDLCVQFVALFIPICMVTAILFAWFEKPFMQMSRQVTKRFK